MERVNFRCGDRVRLAKRSPTPSATVLLIGDKNGTVEGVKGASITVLFDGEPAVRTMWREYLELAV